MSAHTPRVLHATEAAALFPELLKDGGRLPLAVTGHSMEPFLKEGRDTVWLTAPSKPLRRGDIVFFSRPAGEWVLHRIVRLTPNGCVVNGDAQRWSEAVTTEQIVAVAEAVERGGRTLSCGGVRRVFFATVWQWLRPCRRYILAIHRRMYKK